MDHNITEGTVAYLLNFVICNSELDAVVEFIFCDEWWQIDKLQTNSDIEARMFKCDKNEWSQWAYFDFFDGTSVKYKNVFSLKARLVSGSIMNENPETRGFIE